MPQVGPELPPHLAKRKRSIDDAEHPNSPPHKVQAAAAPPRVLGPAPPPSKNPDELDVDDSSDDGYGPSLQPSKPSSPPKRVLGPAPPPPPKNPDELDVDDSSEDEYGPSLQPSRPKSPPPPRRVLGPAPPPGPLSSMPSDPANPDADADPDSSSSSSDDDDFGPSLPPAPGSAAEAQLLAQRSQEETERASAAQEPSKPQRDDWMLVPPSDSDWTSRVDPTKLKNRKFASGKGAKAPAERGVGGISAIWTETPEQKRQRLADEVLGRKDAAASSREAAGPAAARRPEESQEDIETARRIREYNEKNRGRSLYEEHQQQQQQTPREKEDDPSKRAFDREKDMALGGRLGHGQRKELLAKAADFGSRFQKGRYL
ncbi:hypothetical protein M430DRAFT_37500 [Amorphotheca resinae ATCC 22711]|uniref:DUF3752 domain-containing protein n=1 Tax=Amorphotheca resinae ATCC 22711 TaxID=857342 RepID=A0A2T3AR56_AMORE|nr:hypothetical protein M430DRAFT_37500 [Amorphotheca resinae ATCC 22711]PSS08740.1 hypothetical protein M430DRAFT_37500 [Amorphotheca resinae ATCC 22711]